MATAAPRIKKMYLDEVVPALMQKHGYKNKMEVPRLSKIILNMGLGKSTVEPKIVETAAADMARIAGQKPVITRAKKAISNFKLRKGLPIGCMVTLRQRQMYEFFDRLCNVALPRVRDFKGISPKSFDGRGAYTLGVREHYIFPEIEVDKVEKTFGMNVTLVTTAKTPAEAKSLLTQMGLPFREN
ncbi:MAG TPA: 50S ribosomal protein L5 [Bdellovibrionota bacterium]|nr:50S ribosomal protein L5 [Bdellovibrionota bacterium]